MSSHREGSGTSETKWQDSVSPRVCAPFQNILPTFPSYLTPSALTSDPRSPQLGEHGG